ncbi:hypothetical protein HID58_028361 [Brassica napus]|uniref:F-box domain-containing protein n=1 Tax=Brassica napus TaxID=3708 RepID=A0ABQ8CBY3_BRANA|nr:putative F-box protein At1g32420 [Brassica napus]XP_048594895.1 putative F-box protein At1g32420 [Brassica napus]XP_048627200.1 putative F-box protein At1g32420 [Brassica napus]KAH0853948.1 hypothetical protein HID58_092750 [Brassica napus]KAH0913912.1 hypothetical protein HID58_028358 [Brassica napus]KAH0913915.1 hypothetical protein HID58_028361 [Brassica napus]
MARKRKRSGDGINTPLDLTVEILHRLPAKSLARTRCVSKQWRTIIDDYIVKNSVVTRSLSQPSPDAPHFILDTLLDCGVVFSYTYSRQIRSERNQIVEKMFAMTATAREFQYVRGLIGFWSCTRGQFTLHNPTTRRSVPLPDTGIPPRRFYLFGYDPMRNQYKVACIARPTSEPEQSYKVFTLGDLGKEWRNIKCCIERHSPFGTAVCIGGTIYYTAKAENQRNVIISFNVVSEKFSHVFQVPEKLNVRYGKSSLVDYQGKLGCICYNYLNNEDMDVWVMENAEKQEWSKITHMAVLQGIPRSMCRFGVTHPGGEIVIVPYFYYYLGSEGYYYNPNINSRRSFVIQSPRLGGTDLVRIWPVTDPVENIMSLM